MKTIANILANISMVLLLMIVLLTDTWYSDKSYSRRNKGSTRF